MNQRAIILLFALASTFVLPAHAGEPKYTANDVLNFFAQTAPKQITRGICVGSEDECGNEKKGKSQAAFDLLVNFEKDSAELTDEAHNNLLQFAIALQHPRLASIRFAVEGFTDASGPDTHNQILSQRRARSVVAFLTSLGVDESRLLARGYGETRMRVADPLDPINRRVETRVLPEE